MSHRLFQLFVGLLAIAVAGCPSDPVRSNCEIANYRIEGTALTLLPDARLDAVGDDFVLMGTDGNNVHWATLSRSGVIGEEHLIDVPARSAGPWFAMAGVDAPADHVVIAYVPMDAATTGMVNLTTFTVRSDNIGRSAPAVLGQIPTASQVAMSSSRAGMHAGIAWGVPGVPLVSGRVLGGDGLAIGSELPLGTPGDFTCLRFSPGKGDMTIGYVDMSGTPPEPRYVTTEISASGVADPSFRLHVGLQPPSCIEVTPTSVGYGLAWHSAGIGTYLGTFNPSTMQFPTFDVLPDVVVSGPPPGLGGLGWTGKNYLVIFTRQNGGEAWPVDAMGKRQGVLPVFPSMTGHTGALSSQPVGTTVYVTYADYDSAASDSGIRFLVRVSCPQ